jgi:hypothetical protein
VFSLIISLWLGLATVLDLSDLNLPTKSDPNILGLTTIQDHVRLKHLKPPNP